MNAPKKKPQEGSRTIVYQAKSGALELRGDRKHTTIWATQAEMARIFDVNPQAITKHLRNIYRENELAKKGTCSKMEQVRSEGNREVRRTVEIYNLDAMIAVGYRINSSVGTRFRQWATRTLREYVTKGYAIDRRRVARNYGGFMEAVAHIKELLPSRGRVDAESVLELVSAFADTWLSLDAYDKGSLPKGSVTKKKVALTAGMIKNGLAKFRAALMGKGEATEQFGAERERGGIEGIVGNVMQSFSGRELYGTVEEKAAHLLYFIVKNHPFVDGNKRSGAYAFVWYLRRAGILDTARITPPALTALTLLVAESDPKDKEKMVELVASLIARPSSPRGRRRRAQGSL